MDKKLFPKLKTEQIVYFDRLIKESNTNQFAWIKDRYGSKYSNFEEIFSILSNSKLIIMDGEKINFYPSIDEISIDLFLLRLINFSDLSQHIRSYLESFKKEKNKIIHEASTSQKIKYSNLRNFLIEAGYINYNVSSEVYYFLPEKFGILKNILTESDTALKPEVLELIQLQQAEIGRNAELAILNFEKNKLRKHPELLDTIEHVSEYNSSAGFDIKSWMFDTKQNSSPSECFIEVKAVNGDNFKFFWSRNEMAKAQKYGIKYYLYLLPVVGLNKFNFKNLKIISDPYNNIFLGLKWDRQVENYSFKITS